MIQFQQIVLGDKGTSSYVSDFWIHRLADFVIISKLVSKHAVEDNSKDVQVSSRSDTSIFHILQFTLQYLLNLVGTFLRAKQRNVVSVFDHTWFQRERSWRPLMLGQWARDDTS